MTDKESSKALYIKAYFDDLQNRVAFLVELYKMKRKNEALLLCCCYIEAIGSRQSTNPEQKAKNYRTALFTDGKNNIWKQIHPKQLKNVLSQRKLFAKKIDALLPEIDKLGPNLIAPEKLTPHLEPHLNKEQSDWLNDNIFKGSIANISYERIRSELVHDISAANNLSFSETFYEGKPVPELNFEVLYSSLRNIVNASQEKAISTNKWWFEQ